ncbi:MAG: protein adenylyltransferase SelO, partial [Alsobacter sp.]
AGHQFGSFVPQLGDGRAILLGEVVDRHGRRRDIQLKGAGRTPFSRGGDGRAALGPVLREYMVSEAMAALGIPTTRALAAAATGAPVLREAILPGAILTRIAASHLRVGTFQFFAARGDSEALAQLTRYAIARHDPAAADAPVPARAFLEGVVARQAALVARWLLVGFVHGVMNTDNCSISGETIDYGPCAFIDAYDPAAVFSSIDQFGRYAYSNQPAIVQWNLARLAECLLPLMGPDETEALAFAQNAIGPGFAARFAHAYEDGLRRKLGLATARDGDKALAQALLDRMAENRADFTLVFRRLCAAAADPAAEGPVRDLFVDPTVFDSWAVDWRARLAAEGGHPGARATAMRAHNPAVIPRNHRVEAALAAAVEHDDLGPLLALAAALADPYAERGADDPDTMPPPTEAVPYRTFCGT